MVSRVGAGDFLYSACIKTTGRGFVAGMIVAHLPFVPLHSLPEPFSAIAQHQRDRNRGVSTSIIRAYPQYIAIVHGKESHHE
jgi:hypothetical protein